MSRLIKRILFGNTFKSTINNRPVKKPQSVKEIIEEIHKSFYSENELMKPIKLTERQQNKLIKMCDKLFPDRQWFFWRDDLYDDMVSQFIGHNTVCTIGKKNSNYKAVKIHWFEFCLNELLPALKEKDGINFYYKYLSDSINIVDYCYNRFKKLK